MIGIRRKHNSVHNRWPRVWPVVDIQQLLLVHVFVIVFFRAFKNKTSQPSGTWLESQLFWRLRQEEFEASLGNIARPHLKNKMKQKSLVGSRKTPEKCSEGTWSPGAPGKGMCVSG
ncbi:Hypothetical predicted protein [Marmota monax]|uniref:Uncharacterized protein n=1 Tax=Marmota monax TaxID=9995 RepID=A0A5E4BU54_MARMO|nr:hypothetical protein GHT09_010522 [Marmota monax]VTJ73104.1 Hypothetical predicted protein [Marmota monax]